MTDLRARAIALYDAFTHEGGDRRAFMRDMVALAGSAVAAEALVAGIAASPAAAQVIRPDDPRLVASRITRTEAGRPLTAYVCAPAAAVDGRPRGAVLVLHENRGLNAHVEDVTRRLALAGFLALAPDLLSPQGGTPADEDRARTLIGTIDYDLALAQTRAVLAQWQGDPTISGTGAVGFCWGGGFVNRLAVAAGGQLGAGVAYYGPAPDPAEAARVQATMLLHYAERDARVNATGLPWAAALQQAGKRVESHVYTGVDHAFNNDTSAARYDRAAATLAWQRTLVMLHARLDPPAA